MQCETMLYVTLTQTQQMVYYNHISHPVTTIILSQYLRTLLLFTHNIYFYTGIHTHLHL